MVSGDDRSNDRIYWYNKTNSNFTILQFKVRIVEKKNEFNILILSVIFTFFNFCILYMLSHLFLLIQFRILYSVIFAHRIL